MSERVAAGGAGDGTGNRSGQRRDRQRWLHRTQRCAGLGNQHLSRNGRTKAPATADRAAHPLTLPAVPPVRHDPPYARSRRRADADARFEAREQAIQEVNSSAMKQWTQKKVKQQRADAEDSYLRQIKLRALAAYQARM